MLKRISKRHAKKLFADGTSCIIVCPCKMKPEGPFSPGCLLSGKDYLENAEWYSPEKGRESGIWKGTLEETAWHLMYNNWLYYNSSWETGYYAHYYVER